MLGDFSAHLHERRLVHRAFRGVDIRVQELHVAHHVLTTAADRGDVIECKRLRRQLTSAQGTAIALLLKQGQQIGCVDSRIYAFGLADCGQSIRLFCGMGCVRNHEFRVAKQ